MKWPSCAFLPPLGRKMVRSNLGTEVPESRLLVTSHGTLTRRMGVGAGVLAGTSPYFRASWEGKGALSPG